MQNYKKLLASANYPRKITTNFNIKRAYLPLRKTYARLCNADFVEFYSPALAAMAWLAVMATIL